MTRFAVTVTLIELALTLAASVVITVTEGFDPYIRETELSDLGLKAKDYKAYKRRYYFGGAQHISRATLHDKDHRVKVRYIMDVAARDYEWELHRETQRQAEAGPENPMAITLEPFPGESGYGVRQTTPTWVRSVLVRMRGNVMMIVEVWKSGKNLPRYEAARCERNARVIQHYMLAKMGWRQ